MGVASMGVASMEVASSGSLINGNPVLNGWLRRLLLSFSRTVHSTRSIHLPARSLIPLTPSWYSRIEEMTQTLIVEAMKQHIDKRPSRNSLTHLQRP